MAKASMGKQLTFNLPDRPGLLSEITKAVAAAKVNIIYLCAYKMNSDAYFMLVTESNAKAKKALSGLGIKTEEETTLMVELPNKPGTLRDVAAKLSDAGINMSFADCTAVGKAGMCILSTSDDRKAMRLINK